MRRNSLTYNIRICKEANIIQQTSVNLTDKTSCLVCRSLQNLIDLIVEFHSKPLILVHNQNPEWQTDFGTIRNYPDPEWLITVVFRWFRYGIIRIYRPPAGMAFTPIELPAIPTYCWGRRPFGPSISEEIYRGIGRGWLTGCSSIGPLQLTQAI